MFLSFQKESALKITLVLSFMLQAVNPPFFYFLAVFAFGFAFTK
jgi:hypothetical protein